MRRLAILLIPGLALLLAGGCTPTAPSRFYTLAAIPGPPAAATAVSVAVGPVSIPAVVDRPQVVVTTGANQVQMDEFNRWASPLENNISRVVAENLIAMLGTQRVTQFPQALSADSDYRVAIEVGAFQSTIGESASFDAVWTVRRMKDGKTETGRTAVREPAPEKSFDAIAAAHSRAVARMSRDIADAVRLLDGPAR